MSDSRLTPRQLRAMNLKRLGPHWYEVLIPPGYLASRLLQSKPTATGTGTPAPVISAQHRDVPA